MVSSLLLRGCGRARQNGEAHQTAYNMQNEFATHMVKNHVSCLPTVMRNGLRERICRPRQERIIMHSYFDSKGHLFVTCSECDRGGNGLDADKCSCGWQVKRWNKLGCFMGTLLPKYEEARLKAAESQATDAVQNSAPLWEL